MGIIIPAFFAVNPCQPSSIRYKLTKVQRDQRQPLKRWASGTNWPLLKTKKGRFRSVEFSGDVAAADGVGSGAGKLPKNPRVWRISLCGSTRSDSRNDLERLFGNARSWVMTCIPGHDSSRALFIPQGLEVTSPAF